MKKIFFKYFYLLLFFNFSFFVSSENGCKKIDCKLIPVHRISNLISSNVNSKLFSKTRIPFIFGTSTNWSGYSSFANNHAFDSVKKVTGSWIVPKLSSTPTNTYCSIWVGIDGFTSDTVEQIGTEHDWRNGHQTNYAWFEMYPRRAFFISGFPVSVGDVITATVVYQGNNTFILSINNLTKKIFTKIPTKHTTMINTKRNSAEWIVEAPFLNRTLPLANFGLIKFKNCSCSINGKEGEINDSKWRLDKITMTTNNGIPKAIPSNLMNANNKSNFNVVWNHQ